MEPVGGARRAPRDGGQIEDERDRAVAQDRRPREAVDVPVDVAQGLDHRLVLSDHVIDDEADPQPVGARDARSFIDRLPLKPKKWVAPGVWVAAVDTPHAPANRVYLLRVGAGMAAARHEHSGAEFCTVLKGAYRDELGLFSAGDFAMAEGDLNHQPKVEPGEDCICLFATEGRLKAKDAIGRLAFALADV